MRQCPSRALPFHSTISHPLLMASTLGFLLEALQGRGCVPTLGLCTCSAHHGTLPLSPQLVLPPWKASLATPLPRLCFTSHSVGYDRCLNHTFHHPAFPSVRRGPSMMGVSYTAAATDPGPPLRRPRTFSSSWGESWCSSKGSGFRLLRITSSTTCCGAARSH